MRVRTVGLPVVAQPERQLMAAVLLDAIETLRKRCRAADARSQKLLVEVVAWFEDADLSWPFSFARICAALDLDAARVRDRLRVLYDGLPGKDPTARSRNSCRTIPSR